jgi:hypothetical protein
MWAEKLEKSRGILKYKTALAEKAFGVADQAAGVLSINDLLHPNLMSLKMKSRAVEMKMMMKEKILITKCLRIIKITFKLKEEIQVKITEQVTILKTAIRTKNEMLIATTRKELFKLRIAWRKALATLKMWKMKLWRAKAILAIMRSSKTFISDAESASKLHFTRYLKAKRLIQISSRLIKKWTKTMESEMFLIKIFVIKKQYAELAKSKAIVAKAKKIIIEQRVIIEEQRKIMWESSTIVAKKKKLIKLAKHVKKTKLNLMKKKKKHVLVHMPSGVLNLLVLSKPTNIQKLNTGMNKILLRKRKILRTMQENHKKTRILFRAARKLWKSLHVQIKAAIAKKDEELESSIHKKIIHQRFVKRQLHMKMKRLHRIISKKRAVIELLARPQGLIIRANKKIRHARKDIRTSRKMLRSAYYIMKNATQIVTAEIKGLRILVLKKMYTDILLAKELIRKKKDEMKNGRKLMARARKMIRNGKDHIHHFKRKIIHYCRSIKKTMMILTSGAPVSTKIVQNKMVRAQKKIIAHKQAKIKTLTAMKAKASGHALKRLQNRIKGLNGDIINAKLQIQIIMKPKTIMIKAKHLISTNTQLISGYQISIKSAKTLISKYTTIVMKKLTLIKDLTTQHKTLEIKVAKDIVASNKKKIDAKRALITKKNKSIHNSHDIIAKERKLIKRITKVKKEIKYQVKHALKMRNELKDMKAVTRDQVRIKIMGHFKKALIKNRNAIKKVKALREKVVEKLMLQKVISNKSTIPQQIKKARRIIIKSKAELDGIKREIHHHLFRIRWDKMMIKILKNPKKALTKALKIKKTVSLIKAKTKMIILEKVTLITSQKNIIVKHMNIMKKLAASNKTSKIPVVRKVIHAAKHKINLTKKLIHKHKKKLHKFRKMAKLQTRVAKKAHRIIKAMKRRSRDSRLMAYLAVQALHFDQTRKLAEEHPSSFKESMTYAQTQHAIVRKARRTLYRAEKIRDDALNKIKAKITAIKAAIAKKDTNLIIEIKNSISAEKSILHKAKKLVKSQKLTIKRRNHLVKVFHRTKRMLHRSRRTVKRTKKLIRSLAITLRRSIKSIKKNKHRIILQIQAIRMDILQKKPISHINASRKKIAVFKKTIYAQRATLHKGRKTMRQSKKIAQRNIRIMNKAKRILKKVVINHKSQKIQDLSQVRHYVVKKMSDKYKKTVGKTQNHIQKLKSKIRKCLAVIETKLLRIKAHPHSKHVAQDRKDVAHQRMKISKIRAQMKAALTKIGDISSILQVIERPDTTKYIVEGVRLAKESIAEASKMIEISSKAISFSTKEILKQITDMKVLIAKDKIDETGKIQAEIKKEKRKIAVAKEIIESHQKKIVEKKAFISKHARSMKLIKKMKRIISIKVKKAAQFVRIPRPMLNIIKIAKPISNFHKQRVIQKILAKPYHKMDRIGKIIKKYGVTKADAQKQIKTQKERLQAAIKSNNSILVLKIKQTIAKQTSILNKSITIIKSRTREFNKQKLIIKMIKTPVSVITSSTKILTTARPLLKKYDVEVKKLVALLYETSTFIETNVLILEGLLEKGDIAEARKLQPKVQVKKDLAMKTQTKLINAKKLLTKEARIVKKNIKIIKMTKRIQNEIKQRVYQIPVYSVREAHAKILRHQESNIYRAEIVIKKITVIKIKITKRISELTIILQSAKAKKAISTVKKTHIKILKLKARLSMIESKLWMKQRIIMRAKAIILLIKYPKAGKAAARKAYRIAHRALKAAREVVKTSITLIFKSRVIVREQTILITEMIKEKKPAADISKAKAIIATHKSIILKERLNLSKNREIVKKQTKQTKKRKQKKKQNTNKKTKGREQK